MAIRRLLAARVSGWLQGKQREERVGREHRELGREGGAHARRPYPCGARQGDLVERDDLEPQLGRYRRRGGRRPGGVANTPLAFFFLFIRVLFPFPFSVIYLNNAVIPLFEAPNNFRSL